VKPSHILLVFGALLCIAPTVIAQQPTITDETVVIQIADHLITVADIYKEELRLHHIDSEMGKSERLFQAITNVVQFSLTIQAAPKLEVPLAHLKLRADEFVVKEIESAGSINNLLQGKISKLGLLNIEEYNDHIYGRFVFSSVINIISGDQQTAGKGFRVILKPSPAEIRRAYKERMKPEVLKWRRLIFSTETPEQRVKKALADLDGGLIDMQELIDLADHDVPGVGQPKDGVGWIIDFLSSASAGGHLMGPAPKHAPRGSVAMVIVTEKVPATKSLKWNYLQFYPGSTRAQTPEQRVKKALADLDGGSIDMQELIDLADHDVPGVGQPKDSAGWIIDFVSSASAGGYLIGPALPTAEAQMVIATEKTPATKSYGDYTFEKAQPIIVKDLTAENRKKATENFFLKAAAVTDVWVTDDNPIYRIVVEALIGPDIPANNLEEL
jgi:hypothetical protein